MKSIERLLLEKSDGKSDLSSDWSVLLLVYLRDPSGLVRTLKSSRSNLGILLIKELFRCSTGVIHVIASRAECSDCLLRFMEQ